MKTVQFSLIMSEQFSLWTEKPSGNPTCSVHSVSNVDLQYHCRWSGGTPEAQLSFPALSNTSSGAGNFSLTVTASDDLNGKTVTCMADHPIQQNKCNVTASKFNNLAFRKSHSCIML